MYQFNVKYSVVEVREHLLKMVSRGFMPEARAIAIIKEFAKEKALVEDGQLYITIDLEN